MRRNALFITVSAAAAVFALSACDPATSSDDAAGSPASAAPVVSGVPSEAPSTSAAPAHDAATVKACGDLKKDIKDNASKVAKAKKIGPPAGNIAVSAQWTAGSTAVIAHSIGANDEVSAAADVVQKEMMNIGDAYAKSASAKPSTSKLDAAVKKLDTACAAA